MSSTSTATNPAAKPLKIFGQRQKALHDALRKGPITLEVARAQQKTAAEFNGKGS